MIDEVWRGKMDQVMSEVMIRRLEVHEQDFGIVHRLGFKQKPNVLVLIKRAYYP